MNFLDIIVIIPVLWGAFKGFKNGLISEGGTIVALVLGIWASLRFSESIAKYVADYTSVSSEYQQIVAFAVIFVFVLIACFIITRVILRFCKAIKILWLDKLLGVMFGMSKYLVILAFIFYLANTLIKSYATKPIEVVETSLLFKPLAETAETVVSGQLPTPHIDTMNVLDTVKKVRNEDK
ncbi:MAG: CvpA family protein [Bacteroidales bacterium]|nr:CvpA family protein [Bacteroidales bacterium]